MNKELNESGKGYLKLFGIVLAIVIIFLFRHFVLERVIVNGHSMEPNFKNGDVCWASKNYGELNRYDIVLAKVDGTTLIKRVVGLPGDRVTIKSGTVYINDEKIVDEYDYITYPTGVTDYERIDTKDGFYLKLNGEKVSDEIEFTCGDDEFFLLGDNRQNSKDSRMLGCIKKKLINGKIVVRFWPVSSIEAY